MISSMASRLKVRFDLVLFESVFHRLENLLKIRDVAKKARQRRVNATNLIAKLPEEDGHFDGDCD